MTEQNKHEWANWHHVELAEAQETCKHCGCIKVWDAIEGIFYKHAGSDELLLDEPKCITNQTTKDGDSTAT